MYLDRRSFIKQIGLGSIGLALIGNPKYARAAITTGKNLLPRSTPEAQGVSSAAIGSFLDEVAKSKIDFHSIMIVRHGNVIAEGWWSPYAPKLKHTLYSLSKSFTSTAVGLAIDEGHFTIDSPVLSFFPEDKPDDINSNLAVMKVRHLLTMSTGHVKDTIQPMRHATDSWVKTFLNQPVEKEPGSFFLYNTGATYILSAIIQKVSGQTLHEYLRPRLFDPLSINGEDWETDPQGINTGGYGLRIKTEDIAKFGQLFLQKGKWNGKQIVPAKWIEEATSFQIASNSSKPNRPKEEDDWAQGYGYQFWQCRPGGYRGDGAFGQFCMVMPDYDAVIAITSESFSMQNSMNLVWEHLLPAMDKSASTLPSDSVSHTALSKKLKALHLDPPQLGRHSVVADRVSGKHFMLDANEFNAKAIQLIFHEQTCTMNVNYGNAKHQLICGINKWVEQKNENRGTPFPLSGSANIHSPVAGSATWADDNTLIVTLRLMEGAHANGLTFIFADNHATIKFHNSISENNPNAADKRSALMGSYVA
jgi:CubicO group peptidase (beta-lactamase class C family)